MQRERLASDIYIFTSDLYAQVTAGLIVTSEGAILIDTLAYPDETLQIKYFVEERLGTSVRYIINTHFHADHTTGTCFFQNTPVIAHEACRALLDSRGRKSLEAVKASSREMQDVEIVLPNIIFNDGFFNLHLGEKTLQMWSTPGHSRDSIVCLVKEDRILFAADTLMPIPYFVDGRFDDFLTSLNDLRRHDFESVVQGHGEVILPGEVEARVQDDIDYLIKLREAVDDALAQEEPDAALAAIDIESCGKSRVLLNGIGEQLHRQNVLALASERRELIEM
ncbi:MAG: hypothetical protein CUN54_06430 [Phototrophicales bacterium]|nr:MAG: hypothetical protein CUN54_06430 [Phototrophicales bacterium]